MTTRNSHRAIIVSASLLSAVLALSACEKKDNADTAPPNAAASATPTAASAPAYVPPTAAQLSQMVAPIALFPDKLVAQVLAGSTYPDQIIAANQWVGQNAALKGDILQAAEDRQPWDVSVKSLTMFPAVLSQMAANPDWTRALGDAFVNDPNDVMNAIQELRLRAQQAGNLKNSSQLRVSTTVRSSQSQAPVSTPEPVPVYAGAPVIAPPPQTIVIESSQPDTVYVPSYNPVVVYGPPVPVYPGYAYRPPSRVGNEVVVGALSFGVGIFVGEAISHHADWGWHDWGMHWGGSPAGAQSAPGWQRPAVVYRNTTYVSHSTTVINRVTNNNVTINNNRVVNNNVSNINNVSNVRNVSNVDERNISRDQTRIDNHPEAANRQAGMSMPHFTANDAHAGAMPAVHPQPQPQHPQSPVEAADVHRQQAEQKQAAQANAARQHQEMEQQVAREHQQAQQNAAQQERQQAEQRQALALKQEAARAQPAHPAEHKEAVPVHPQAAARPEARQESRPVHPQQAPAERHEAAAHEHASEQHAAQKHEPARHEEDKRGNERHEAEKHNG